MAALPQCDAFGYIYDQAGDPAPDVLVTLKKVIDASGNSILLSPLTTLTDPAGSFHFTLPEDAAATISARASGLWNCPDGRVFKVPPGPTGELIATFLLPGSSSVVPPLIYVSDTLSLPRSSASADGYLAAADWLRFDAATDVTGGVSSFASRTGDIVPIVSDYQAFYLRLSGGALTGALTLAADPTMPMQAATMQYVLAQLASATAGVASFNGRTGTVLPLGPDYASFYAPVSHSHTRSQITDLGVFSTSQPGLVPQPTSGDAAKVLTGAGTWVAQAAGSGTTLAGTYNVTDFKASGSPTKFTGTISSGSTTLTTTVASNFAIGQGIYIAGGGAGGTAPLITKVTAISGVTITLQDAAAATVTAIANNVQHDDTVAIQTAIDTVCSSGGGTIQFAPGLYRINGPLQATNSILKIPFNSTSNAAIALSLVGYAPAFLTWDGPVSTTGVIIQTDRIGTDTNSCMLAGAAYSPTVTDFTLVNNTMLTIEGMLWRTYNNPQIGAIDLAMLGTHECVRNVGIDVGAPLLGAAEPMHGTFGLRLARNNTITECLVENVEVSNYGIGVIACEVVHFINVTAQLCTTGLRITPGHHLVSGRLLLWQCPTLLEIVGGGGPAMPSVIDLTLDIEKADTGSLIYRNSPDTFAFPQPVPGHDFYDPTNSAVGKIEYMMSTGGTGALQTASVLGMDNVTLINLGIPATAQAGTLTGESLVTHDLTVTGTEFIFNDGTILQPISFGLNDSGGSGFRELRIPNPAPTGLLTGIVSYWKMDETSPTGNRVDQVASTNNLVVTSTLTAPTLGKLGDCAFASAGGGWLTVADNASQNFSTAAGISITGWINIVSFSQPIPTILAKFDGTTQHSFLLCYNSGTGNFQWTLSADGVTDFNCQLPFAPAFGTWYFVAATWDGTTMRLSVNAGTPVTLGFVGPIVHTTNVMESLIFNFGGTGFAADAKVDEVGLWSRALSATEIATLYAGGTGLTYPF
jgi:hypothetical protein